MAYKVLSRLDGRLYSAVSAGDFRLEYDVGVMVEAKPVFKRLGFGICCFEGLHTAEDFYDTWMIEHGKGLRLPKGEIWQCIGIDYVPLPEHQAFTRTHTLVDFEHMVKAVWPEGTVMYRAIKLTRRVL